MNPEVSIIIPVYNAEKWLDRCIVSVLNQSFENWELILVDDGSKDESLAICAKYAEADNRIRIFSQENSGPSKARNRGIKESRGKYIMFVDSDDYVSTEYISNLLRPDDSDLVVGGIVSVFPQLKSERCNPIVKEPQTYKKDDYYEGILFGELQESLMSPCSKIYRSEIVKKNDIRFNSNLKYGEDHLFNLKYLNYCHSISFIEKCDYYYVHHGEPSLTNSMVDPNKMFHYIKIMVPMRKEFCKKMKHKDSKRYKDFINQTTSFLFWQTVHRIYLTYPGNNQERLRKLNFLIKNFNHKEIYNRHSLPPTYRIMQLSTLVFPLSIADSIIGKMVN